MRWDWCALHIRPNVEFYNRCVDVTVSSSSAVTKDNLGSAMRATILLTLIVVANSHGRLTSGKFRADVHKKNPTDKDEWQAAAPIHPTERHHGWRFWEHGVGFSGCTCW